MRTYYTAKKGLGREVSVGDKVDVHYRIFVCSESCGKCVGDCHGEAIDGNKIKTASFVVGKRTVHEPIDTSIVGMQYGGCRRYIYVPAVKAFSHRGITRNGVVVIQPNTALCVEIEVKEESIKIKENGNEDL